MKWGSCGEGSLWTHCWLSDRTTGVLIPPVFLTTFLLLSCLFIASPQVFFSPSTGLDSYLNRSLSHSGRRLQSAGAGWSSVLSLLKTILAESKKMRIFELDMFIELLGAQPTLTSTSNMNNLLCFIKWDIIHSTKVDGKSHWWFLVPQDVMMFLLNRKSLSTQCERAKTLNTENCRGEILAILLWRAPPRRTGS